jgi:hypothetical protein
MLGHGCTFINGGNEVPKSATGRTSRRRRITSAGRRPCLKSPRLPASITCRWIAPASSSASLSNSRVALLRLPWGATAWLSALTFLKPVPLLIACTGRPGRLRRRASHEAPKPFDMVRGTDMPPEAARKPAGEERLAAPSARHGAGGRRIGRIFTLLAHDPAPCRARFLHARRSGRRPWSFVGRVLEKP